jgi:hypothetical protein
MRSVDRDLRASVLTCSEPSRTVQVALIGPVSLFRGDNGVSGIAASQSGSDKPLIRPLEGEMAHARRSALVATGEGTLPLDPSRGGALKGAGPKTEPRAYLHQGWPDHVANISLRRSLRFLELRLSERRIFLLNDRRLRSRRALSSVPWRS